MAFEGKGGKKFTNADSMRSHNAMSGGKAPMAKMPGAMAGAPAEMEGQKPEDGAEIAEQHGPAVEVHSQHDDQMGVHHVTSEHPDGHHHESDHGSREEAHEHAGKLKGVGKKEHAEPDGEEMPDDWDKE